MPFVMRRCQCSRTRSFVVDNISSLKSETFSSCGGTSTLSIALTKLTGSTDAVLTLTGKILSLAGHERGSEVILPPFIGFVQITDLRILRVGLLRQPVAESEVVVKSHKLSEINVRNTLIATDDQHILVVRHGRRFAEVC